MKEECLPMHPSILRTMLKYIHTYVHVYTYVCMLCIYIMHTLRYLKSLCLATTLSIFLAALEQSPRGLDRHGTLEPHSHINILDKRLTSENCNGHFFFMSVS